MNSDKMVRDKITEMGSLPDGIRFDKAAAWGELEGRMKKKKVVALLYIRWAAAAVLLIGLGIGLYLRRSTNAKIAVKQPLQVPVNNSIPDNKQNITENNKTGGVLPAEKLLVRRPKGYAAYQQRQFKDTAPRTIVTQVALIKPIDAVQPAPVKTNTLIAVKNPMKTVHINELDDESAGTETRQARSERPDRFTALLSTRKNKHQQKTEELDEAIHTTILINNIIESEN